MSRSNENADDSTERDEVAAPIEKDASPKSLAGAGHRPPDRDQPFWLRKRSVLLWVFAATILLTIYVYLDQAVFAPNRPIIWTKFTPEKIDKAEREDSLVVLLVGTFQSQDDFERWVVRIDVPEVRREAHRIKSVFSVVELEAKDADKTPIRNWVAARIGDAPNQPPSMDYAQVVIDHKKWEHPRIFIMGCGDIGGQIQSVLNEYRSKKILDE